MQNLVVAEKQFFLAIFDYRATLTNRLHIWNKQTNWNGSAVRIMLFDFKKRSWLDRPLHSRRKKVAIDISHSITEWMVDFRKDRKRRVKLSKDCFSECGTVPASVRWYRKLGPWMFVIMINEHEHVEVLFWKAGLLGDECPRARRTRTPGGDYKSANSWGHDPHPQRRKNWRERLHEEKKEGNLQDTANLGYCYAKVDWTMLKVKWEQLSYRTKLQICRASLH